MNKEKNSARKMEKPLVSILLATYNPNEAWFCELLSSLNEQSYPNLELLVWDDCPTKPIDTSLLSRFIKNFPYTYYLGEKNLGSNLAFEKLTKCAQGSYFAYCDHDDRWCAKKIEKMVEKLEETQSPLVCCDVYIMDAEGNTTGTSIKDAHKRHVFREGNGLAAGLVTSNFVMGCAMLVRAEIAKKSLPFNENFVHDHWIAIVAALSGRIEVLREPLLYHRKHGGNQTGVLAGIGDKQQYYTNLLRVKQGLDSLCARFPTLLQEDASFRELNEWMNARVRYFKHPNVSSLKIMRQHCCLNRHHILFEQFAPFIPSFILKILLKMLQKGVL